MVQFNLILTGEGWPKGTCSLWREQSWERKLGKNVKFLIWSSLFLKRKKLLLMLGFISILLLVNVLLQTVSLISRQGNTNLIWIFFCSSQEIPKTKRPPRTMFQVARPMRRLGRQRLKVNMTFFLFTVQIVSTSDLVTYSSAFLS